MARSIHITQIESGMTLRVSMKNGQHLVPDHRGQLVRMRHHQRDRGFSYATFFCCVQSNDPQAGTIDVVVVGRQSKQFSAQIRYTAIHRVQRWQQATTIIETATANRPGAVAMGTSKPGPPLINPVHF